MTALVKRVAGSALIVVGVLIATLAAIALFDPSGSKMADDNDPFGTPMSRSQSLAMIAIGTVSALFGWRTLRTAPTRDPAKRKRRP